MEVATTTEATLSAIHESLAQLSVKLGRIAARQDEMLVDMKKTTTALMPIGAIATTTPTFVPSRALEQKTTPSSSSLFSGVQVGGVGAPRADAVLAPTMPTSCSAEGLAHYTDHGHAELVFPTSGSTHLPAATSTLARNNTLQYMGEAGVNTPTGCSTHVLTWPRDTPGVRAQDVGTDMSSEVLTHVGGLSLFQEQGVDGVGLVLPVLHSEESMLQQLVLKEDCRHFARIIQIYFMNLPLDVNVWEDSKSRIMATVLRFQWDPGIMLNALMDAMFGDGCLLQFGCYTTGIVLEMHHENDNSVDLCEREEVDAWQVLSKIQPGRLSGFSPEKSEHQHDLHCKNIGSSIHKEIMQQIFGIVTLWDLGISNAETNVVHPAIFATRGDCVVLNWMPPWEDRSDFSQHSVNSVNIQCFYPWERNAPRYGNNNKHLTIMDVLNGYLLLLQYEAGSYMHCNAGQRIKSAELGHFNTLQQLTYCWAWAPDRYVLEAAVSNLISVKIERGNIYVFPCQLLNESLQDGHVYLTHDTLEKHAAVSWRHTSSKLQVQLPWDPGDVHTNTLCSRFTQSILCVALGRPWDPGIVAIREWTVLADISSEVRATMCDDWTEPLLEGKQCFLGAAMSCPQIERHWALSLWAMAHVGRTNVATNGMAARVIGMEEN